MIINNNKIQIKRFSSGEFRLMQSQLLPLAQNNQVTILYKQEESLFELYLVCKFYEEFGIDVNLVLGYLPYQRMDHVGSVEAQTVKYVKEFFNSMNLKSIKICEPHCDINDFNNSKKVPLVNLILNKVAKKYKIDLNEVVFAFTDKGSLARYGHLCKKAVYFEKARDKQTGLIASHKMVGTLNKNDKVILLDDIISTGDTINSCLNYIDNKVIIICGHFEKNKYNKQLLENEKVVRIFSSDSLTRREKDKLEIFKIEDLINDFEKSQEKYLEEK